MAKAPRRKKRPTLVIRMGATGSRVEFEGVTFSLTGCTNKQLSDAAANVSACCRIS